MEDLIVPIDRAGRLVLPKSVREDLAIEPGDKLMVSIRGNEITLRPNKFKAGFIRRRKALVFSTGGKELLGPEIVDKILKQERDRRADQIIQRMKKQKRKR